MKLNTINMISSIKNGYISKKLFINCKNTIINNKILNILYNQGFIRGYIYKNNNIQVLLKYSNNESVIKELNSISKPGNNKYLKKNNINNLNKDKLYIISTSDGILPLNNINNSGEILLEIK